MNITKKIHLFSENDSNLTSFINSITLLYPGYTIEAFNNQATAQYILNTFGTTGAKSIITNTYNKIQNNEAKVIFGSHVKVFMEGGVFLGMNSSRTSSLQINDSDYAVVSIKNKKTPQQRYAMAKNHPALLRAINMNIYNINYIKIVNRPIETLQGGVNFAIKRRYRIRNQ